MMIARTNRKPVRLLYVSPIAANTAYLRRAEPENENLVEFVLYIW